MSVSRGLYRNSLRTILMRVVLLIATGVLACPVEAQTNSKSLNPFKKIAAMFPAGSGVSQASYKAPQVPQLQMPQVNLPQVNLPNGGQMPQMQMPQMQMPQMQMPQVGQMKMPQLGQMPSLNGGQYPALKMPTGQSVMNSLGIGSQQKGPLGLVDKWNQTVSNFMGKAKQKLTLPQLKLPQLGGAQQQSNGGFLSGLMQTQATQQQPPTLQNWLGQPRPQ